MQQVGKERRSVVNFINVFTRSFYTCRSWKRKKLLELTVFFALLGSALIKAACKMLVKLTLALLLLLLLFSHIKVKTENKTIVSNLWTFWMDCRFYASDRENRKVVKVKFWRFHFVFTEAMEVYTKAEMTHPVYACVYHIA